jgi:hypothetical protein
MINIEEKISVLSVLIQSGFVRDNVHTSFPHQRYPYCDILLGFTCCSDPESCAGGSIATGRVSHTSQIKGDG